MRRYLDSLYRKFFFRSLRNVESGLILVTERYLDEVTSLGNAGAGDPVIAIDVRDPAFYRAVVLRGSVGAAEAWSAGHWDSPDLEPLIQLMLRNREVLDGMESGLAKLASWTLRIADRGNANTLEGSLRNIASHYDLGNRFFAAFLDSTMTYSSAIFDEEHTTLHDAQLNKLDRLCQKLDLRPTDHVLEIGTGWGSFAIYAAQTYGCRVTTTTISRAQAGEARRRVADAGLSDRVEVLLRDYRQLGGKFDKIASIEMVEAVGNEYLETWFESCGNLLRPEGCMAFQAITIQDQHFRRALRDVDFIKNYIFPGSFIPSSTRLLEAATATTDLRLLHMEDFGPHYAETLRRWSYNLESEWPRLLRGGITTEFLRMWKYYLGYCAGGFEERFLGVAQFLFRKPKAVTQPLLGRLQPGLARRDPA